MAVRRGVIVVGSFNVDHAWRCETLPAPGATLAGEYASGPGGKGFNQAMAAARAGAATTFVCALGDDPGGALARALAADEGITLHAAHSELRTGTAGIFVDASGNNSIVIGPGANDELGVDFVEAQRERIGGASVVLAQLESPAASIDRALAIGRASGATTLLNPAPANARTTPELLALADILVPNETEFVALLSRHCGVDIAPAQVPAMDDGDLHALCRRLSPAGTTVVTLGAAGCLVSHPANGCRGDARDHYRIPADVLVPVDTTGAGDAFNGAMAASLSLRDAAFAEHARFASHYAGLSTLAQGAALAMPRLK